MSLNQEGGSTASGRGVRICEQAEIIYPLSPPVFSHRDKGHPNETRIKSPPTTNMAPKATATNSQLRRSGANGISSRSKLLGDQNSNSSQGVQQQVVFSEMAGSRKQQTHRPPRPDTEYLSRTQKNPKKQSSHEDRQRSASNRRRDRSTSPHLSAPLHPEQHVPRTGSRNIKRENRLFLKDNKLVNYSSCTDIQKTSASRSSFGNLAKLTHISTKDKHKHEQASKRRINPNATADDQYYFADNSDNNNVPHVNLTSGHFLTQSHNSISQNVPNNPQNNNCAAVNPPTQTSTCVDDDLSQRPSTFDRSNAIQQIHENSSSVSCQNSMPNSTNFLKNAAGASFSYGQENQKNMQWQEGERHQSSSAMNEEAASRYGSVSNFQPLHGSVHGEVDLLNNTNNHQMIMANASLSSIQIQERQMQEDQNSEGEYVTAENNGGGTTSYLTNYGGNQFGPNIITQQQFDHDHQSQSGGANSSSYMAGGETHTNTTNTTSYNNNYFNTGSAIAMQKLPYHQMTNYQHQKPNHHTQQSYPQNTYSHQMSTHQMQFYNHQQKPAEENEDSSLVIQAEAAENDEDESCFDERNQMGYTGPQEIQILHPSSGNNEQEEAYYLMNQRGRISHENMSNFQGSEPQLMTGTQTSSARRLEQMISDANQMRTKACGTVSTLDRSVRERIESSHRDKRLVRPQEIDAQRAKRRSYQRKPPVPVQTKGNRSGSRSKSGLRSAKGVQSGSFYGNSNQIRYQSNQERSRGRRVGENFTKTVATSPRNQLLVDQFGRTAQTTLIPNQEPKSILKSPQIGGNGSHTGRQAFSNSHSRLRSLSDQSREPVPQRQNIPEPHLRSPGSTSLAQFYEDAEFVDFLKQIHLFVASENSPHKKSILSSEGKSGGFSTRSYLYNNLSTLRDKFKDYKRTKEMQTTCPTSLSTRSGGVTNQKHLKNNQHQYLTHRTGAPKTFPNYQSQRTGSSNQRQVPNQRVRVDSSSAIKTLPKKEQESIAFINKLYEQFGDSDDQSYEQRGDARNADLVSPREISNNSYRPSRIDTLSQQKRREQESRGSGSRRNLLGNSLANQTFHRNQNLTERRISGRKQHMNGLPRPGFVVAPHVQDKITRQEKRHQKLIQETKKFLQTSRSGSRFDTVGGMSLRSSSQNAFSNEMLPGLQQPPSSHIAHFPQTENSENMQIADNSSQFMHFNESQQNPHQVQFQNQFVENQPLKSPLPETYISEDHDLSRDLNCVNFYPQQNLKQKHQQFTMTSRDSQSKPHHDPINSQESNRQQHLQNFLFPEQNQQNSLVYHDTVTSGDGTLDYARETSEFGSQKIMTHRETTQKDYSQKQNNYLAINGQDQMGHHQNANQNEIQTGIVWSPQNLQQIPADENFSQFQKSMEDCNRFKNLLLQIKSGQISLDNTTIEELTNSIQAERFFNKVRKDEAKLQVKRLECEDTLLSGRHSRKALNSKEIRLEVVPNDNLNNDNDGEETDANEQLSTGQNSEKSNEISAYDDTIPERDIPQQVGQSHRQKGYQSGFPSDLIQQKQPKHSRFVRSTRFEEQHENQGPVQQLILKENVENGNYPSERRVIKNQPLHTKRSSSFVDTYGASQTDLYTNTDPEDLISRMSNEISQRNNFNGMEKSDYANYQKSSRALLQRIASGKVINSGRNSQRKQQMQAENGTQFVKPYLDFKKLSTGIGGSSSSKKSGETPFSFRRTTAGESLKR